jgi:hypothetical protein
MSKVRPANDLAFWLFRLTMVGIAAWVTAAFYIILS